MTLKLLPSVAPSTEKFIFKKWLHSIWRQRWLYFLMTPTLIYFAIFKYGPLWNAQIAFKDFKPLLGVWGSPWVGFEHFETFMNSFYFAELIRNTIIFSLAKLLLGLPIAVICAIALHETWLVRFRIFCADGDLPAALPFVGHHVWRAAGHPLAGEWAAQRCH